MLVLVSPLNLCSKVIFGIAKLSVNARKLFRNYHFQQQNLSEVLLHIQIWQTTILRNTMGGIKLLVETIHMLTNNQ